MAKNSGTTRTGNAANSAQRATNEDVNSALKQVEQLSYERATKRAKRLNRWDLEEEIRNTNRKISLFAIQAYEGDLHAKSRTAELQGELRAYSRELRKKI